MKKYIGLFVCALSLSAPSFAADHFVSRSVKGAAKDTYKVTKVSAEKSGRAPKSAVKFLF